MNKKLLVRIFFTLNILDTFNTIYLVTKRGFVELNPLFSYLLRKDIALFILAKFFLTVMTSYCLNKSSKTSTLLVVLVAFFGCLVGWQFFCAFFR